MNKLTAEWCKYLLNDLQRQSVTGCGIGTFQEGYLQALEIALPALEQKTHESVITEQLEAVKDSLELNPHQNAIISCAIDRLNELNVRVVDLSRALFDRQPQPSTTPQIDNDGWIEWGGGKCPVAATDVVEVKLDSGELGGARLACGWSWQRAGKRQLGSNIVAYRVIDNGGWVEWGGGPCPVDPKMRVEVKLRDGFINKLYRAYQLSWKQTGGNSDIIAYRVIESDGGSRDKI